LAFGGTPGAGGADFAARAGNSTVSVSDSGVLQIGRALWVGTTGGAHTWTLSGGKLDRAGATGQQFYFGNNSGSGSVSFDQTAGTNDNASAHTYVRGTAQYDISGDPAGVTMISGNLYVDGTLNQSGGYVNNTWELWVGNTAGATGVYTATAGNLRTRGLHIADVADSSGTLTLHAGVTYTSFGITGTDPQRFVVGATSGSGTGTLEVKGLGNIINGGGGGFARVELNQTGVIKGYGTLSGFGFLRVNGRVIADGYGSDQTLALGAGNDPLTNTVDNTTDKGLYAVNGGELTLRNLTIAAGNSTNNWGESAGDADIDLVNSVRIAYTGGSSGSLSGSLLATDRSDVPAGLLQPVGIWDFSSPTFTSATLTFRYDHLAVADQGTGTLLVKRHNGSEWEDVTGSVDTVNRRITTTAVSPQGGSNLGAFAVMVLPPPAGTVVVIR
jgi:hypothetical protein